MTLLREAPYSAASTSAAFGRSAKSGLPLNTSGNGPPVAQSSSSTVWTIGIDVPDPIWVMQPIFPAAITCGFVLSMLRTLRSRSCPAISG